MIYSSDNGNSWRNSILTEYINAITYNGYNIIVDSFKKIYSSFDNGLTWITIYNGMDDQDLWISSLESIDENIFAGGQEDILYSSNNGQFWTTINNGFDLQVLARNLWILGDFIFLNHNCPALSVNKSSCLEVGVVSFVLVLKLSS